MNDAEGVWSPLCRGTHVTDASDHNAPESGAR
jgi:hypothetical protein